MGYHDRAIRDLDQVIKLNASNAQAYNVRGLALSNKRDFDRAIADFSQAIKLDPKLAAAYNNRGLAYRGKGDNDRAIADFSTAAKIDPNYALGLQQPRQRLFRQARIRPRHRRPQSGDQAQPELRARLLRPRHRLRRQGRERPAPSQDFDHAIKLDPRNAVAFNNRGLAYRNKGDSDRAIADFNEAIKLNAELRRSPITIAPTPIIEKRDLDRAIADFEPGDQTQPQGSHSRCTTAALPITTSTTSSMRSPISKRRSRSIRITPSRCQRARRRYPQPTRLRPRRHGAGAADPRQPDLRARLQRPRHRARRQE